LVDKWVETGALLGYYADRTPPMSWAEANLLGGDAASGRRQPAVFLAWQGSPERGETAVRSVTITSSSGPGGLLVISVAVRVVLIAMVVAALATGCSASTPSGSPTPLPQAVAAPPGGTHVTKVLTVVEENHSLAQMRSSMPFLSAMATQYAYATGYTAVSHPSLPNYLALSGGSTFGITDDRDPSAHPIPGQSVFGQALAAGKTAKVYAESMPPTARCPTPVITRSDTPRGRITSMSEPRARPAKCRWAAPPLARLLVTSRPAACPTSAGRFLI